MQSASTICVYRRQLGTTKFTYPHHKPRVNVLIVGIFVQASELFMTYIYT